MKTEVEVLAALEEAGAMLRGHFVLSSWRHGDQYIQKDLISCDTWALSPLCREIARRVWDREFDAVIAPATAGIPLSQWVAYHLSDMSGRRIVSVYAEKSGERDFKVRSSFVRLISNKRVLAVEDILTTGGSLREVVVLAREYGAYVDDAAVLFNRGDVQPIDVDVKTLTALVTQRLPDWAEPECPLCAEGVSIDRSPGRGADWLARKEAGKDTWTICPACGHGAGTVLIEADGRHCPACRAPVFTEA